MNIFNSALRGAYFFCKNLYFFQIAVDFCTHCVYNNTCKGHGVPNKKQEAHKNDYH
nr:MAG TPA: hypothetical protein [Caudoviricetes sp.]